MRTPRVYRRLASARQFGGGSGGLLSLYRGPDHLLLRSSSGVTETYRRFYFADIEAITIAQTVRGIFWNATFAFGIFFSLLPIILQRPPHYVSASFLAFFTLLLLVNVMRGATCRAQLQTRVQTQRLPLRRVRKAVRVVNQIRADIDAAQANFVATAAPPAPPSAAARREAAESATIPPPLADEDSPATPWLEISMAAVLIFTGLLALLTSFGHKVPLMYGVLVFVGANVALAMAVVVRQRNRDRGKGARVVAWTSLIGHAVAFPTVYGGLELVAGIRRAESLPANQQSVFVVSSMNEIMWTPGFGVVLLVYAICCLVLGIAGGAMIARDPSRRDATMLP